MALLKDKIYPDDFGECGGVGRCGTCLVKTEGRKDALSLGKEGNTLAKMGISDPHFRLACQIQVDENLNNTVIEIMDNY
jgi:2Fe-2S ferredoxin